MKKLFTLLALIFPLSLLAGVQNDTIISVNGNDIEVKELDNQINVRVYDSQTSVEKEMIFEGHYKDGKSSERRKYIKNISIPVIDWDRSFDSHWAGFGMGLANIADGFDFNDIDGVSLNGGTSREYNLNLFDKSFLLYRNRLALVTGFGFRWSRYRITGNKYFIEKDDMTYLEDMTEWKLKKSKLNITYITIPVLLEWQKKFHHNSPIFVSGGIVGQIRTCSSSKIEYRNLNNKRVKDIVDKGLNLLPLNMDFLLQAGYGSIGVYAHYSPFSLFRSGKGPDIQPVGIGLQIYF
ncbi:MAG: PorT family protein [Bacteroidales bacterium]|nr:PorT family protein [Bacteroidales bacterium]